MVVGQGEGKCARCGKRSSKMSEVRFCVTRLPATEPACICSHHCTMLSPPPRSNPDPIQCHRWVLSMPLPLTSRMALFSRGPAKTPLDVVSHRIQGFPSSGYCGRNTQCPHGSAWSQHLRCTHSAPFSSWTDRQTHADPQQAHIAQPPTACIWPTSRPPAGALMLTPPTTTSPSKSG